MVGDQWSANLPLTYLMVESHLTLQSACWPTKSRVPISASAHTCLPARPLLAARRYLSALRSCFAAGGRQLVGFERYMKLKKSGGNHAHINAIAVPGAIAGKARQVRACPCCACCVRFALLTCCCGSLCVPHRTRLMARSPPAPALAPHMTRAGVRAQGGAAGL